jgi:signal transduction histidine kinase
MVEVNQQRRKVAAAVLIALLSASLGLIVDWRAPGIGRYAGDWLMRTRGTLPVPSEIAIVAIDEKSVASFGRFPWPRSVLAKTIDALAADDPKVIAVDVLFPDPTAPDEDEALSRAIDRAGNVVLAAQLVNVPADIGPAAWLLPLPVLTEGAAGVGHVNVQVESEGVARQIAVQVADDQGQTLRSMAIEAVRVAGGTPRQNVMFTGRSILVGARPIPLDAVPATVLIGEAGPRRPKQLQTGRFTVDYIGPAGSFDPVTYSVTDVLRGAVPAAAFRGKYVLIGATAASLGDHVASPFVHDTDTRSGQHGGLMPGVEVMANAINTILRARFYSETGAWAAFFWAAFIAGAALFILERSQGRLEVLRQAAGLAGLAAAVSMLGYLEFTRLLIFPPMVPALVALASSALLGLFWRSLAASSQLDASISQLTASSEILPSPPGRAEWSRPGWLPHGLEWKAEKIRDLNARLVERARFVDLALRSVQDGLIIATAEGMITFANRSAGAILMAPAETLTGQNLFERLDLTEEGMLRRVVVERARIEREIEMREVRSRRYVLRLAAVAAGDDPAEPVYGIVASLSDVTRQHELQQTKNDVIALVSHEMRTPLTAIQGMTELLATYDIDAARRKEFSAAINEEVKRLTSMITEYLDITRLESGATSVHKAPLKVETVLQRLVLLLGPVAGQRDIGLQLETDPALPALFADLDLLSRAVENLLSNAIKYSPRGTEVVVKAARENGSIAISVADRGYGIPEEDLARIFEKFFRVPRAEDADAPGTGLGLALVREIAELHGGAVTVTSELHVGSTFTLSIPLSNGTHVDQRGTC